MKKTKTVQEVCDSHGLQNEEIQKVTDLIKVNSGYVSWSMLRSHLTKGSGLCMRLTEDLYAHKLATYPPDDHKIKSLKPANRNDFM